MKTLTKTLLLLAFLPSLAFAEHVRVTNPNAFSVELLGKGLAYSLQYDRVIDDDLVVGFGYGHVGLKRGEDDLSEGVSLIPAYAHYYFAREQASFFGMAGVTIVTDSSAASNLESTTGGLDFASSPVVPVIGLGYENRGDAGFLFRTTLYGMLGKTYTPWLGVTFGYSF
ncbi:MAG: hypothetical protein NDJ90_11240 [Oligoflexia bacterium]|nr:hypothetical protein [Oligoflexia bacterium]